MHKPYREVEETDDSSVYNKAYKKFESKQSGKCDRCGWHDGENKNRKKQRSWKRLKKTKHQFQ